jgi:hypothetical protein
MESAELKEYKKLIEETDELKKKIERYLYTKDGDIDGMSYGKALRILSRMRAKIRMTPKKVKEEYGRSKFPSAE